MVLESSAVMVCPTKKSVGLGLAFKRKPRFLPDPFSTVFM